MANMNAFVPLDELIGVARRLRSRLGTNVSVDVELAGALGNMIERLQAFEKRLGVTRWNGQHSYVSAPKNPLDVYEAGRLSTILRGQ